MSAGAEAVNIGQPAFKARQAVATAVSGETMPVPDPSEDAKTGASNVSQLIALLQVAHHVPGRLRVRLVGHLSSLRALQGSGTLDALRRLPGIISVDVNTWARSCVVRYDTEVISPQSLQDVFAGVPGADAARLVRVLERAAEGGECDGEGCG